jgi:hypothetical protein
MTGPCGFGRWHGIGRHGHEPDDTEGASVSLWVGFVRCQENEGPEGKESKRLNKGLRALVSGKGLRTLIPSIFA